jgi:large subunit ribosomal protein L30
VPKKAAGASRRRKTTAKKKASPARKPKKTPPKPKASAAKLRVKQVRSGIGRAGTYRRTLRALGLKHHQDEVVVKDNASIRGMLHKVKHLVRVSVEEAP